MIALLFFCRRILRYNLFISSLIVVMTTAFTLMYGDVPVTVSLFLDQVYSFFIYLAFPCFYGAIFLFHIFNRSEWMFFLNLGFSRRRLIFSSQAVYGGFSVLALIVLHLMRGILS
ncbi:MAG: hypothetical protein JXR86_07385 [Spirochaetales bacterium]|nr:hypothetical protein [Spirochaetales bacterium]